MLEKNILNRKEFKLDVIKEVHLIAKSAIKKIS
jgi:hypothetical protein